MELPALVAVDDDRAALSRLEDALVTRYGRSYAVVAERSARGALPWLQEHAAAGGEVALLLADQWMPEMTGIEFLAEAGSLHPHARRILMTGPPP